MIYLTLTRGEAYTLQEILLRIMREENPRPRISKVEMDALKEIYEDQLKWLEGGN